MVSSVGDRLVLAQERTALRLPARRQSGPGARSGSRARLEEPHAPGAAARLLCVAWTGGGLAGRVGIRGADAARGVERRAAVAFCSDESWLGKLDQ
jgi:hypothetical protein